MEYIQDHLKPILLLTCFGIFLIPAIVLMILYHHDDITMNTQGYFLPGGNCHQVCDFDDDCKAIGKVNVTFYPPIEYNLTEMVTILIEVPLLCKYGFDEVAFCCQNLIEEHVLIWMYVGLDEGQFSVEYLSLSEMGNTGSFLIVGIIFLIVSLCIGGFFIKDCMCKECHHSSYSIV